MNRRRSNFINTTRWLADSSFLTYFGKPPFHPYGRANTNPALTRMRHWVNNKPDYSENLLEKRA